MPDETSLRRARATTARTLIAGTSIAAACIGLAACGGGGSKVAAATPPSASGAPSTARPATSTSTTVPTVLQTVVASYGAILTDARGFVLYTYSGDTPAKLGCTGPCLSLWAPLLLRAGATRPTAGPGVGGLGTVVRAEGVQVTYGGRPLYTFVRDTMPAQAGGQGFGGGRWTVVAAGSAGPAVTGSTGAPAPAAAPASPVTAAQAPVTAAPPPAPTVTQPAVTVPPATPAPTTRPTSPPTTAPGGGPSY